MKINKLGILSTLLPCLIGSATYSTIIYFHFNNFGGFYITLLDIILLCLILLLLSVIISIPIVFYVSFSIRNHTINKILFKKINTLFLIYCTVFYLFCSYLMNNAREGLELTLAYVISGSISLNLYLAKIKRNVP
jgi:hypothetical protein